MGTVTYQSVARDFTSGRSVFVSSDGEYCAWTFFANGVALVHPRNQLGGPMDMPYCVDSILRRWLPGLEIPENRKDAITRLARCLLFNYKELAFEIAPDEWCTAA